MALTPSERREQSNPVLIGVFTAFFSPLSSVIWGVRQRSWSLALAPTTIAFAFTFIAALEANEENFEKGIQYSFQLTSGLIAYEISKTLKDKASKTNSGIKIN